VHIAAVIPAYCPTEQLIDVAKALASFSTFAGIIVIDDGSGDRYRAIFDHLQTIQGVTVLRHAVNLGKGSALKTGMNFALVKFPKIAGVVTADADGQHSPSDIRRVAERLLELPNTLVLGARGFEGKMPLRSRIGNSLTRAVFRILIGHRVKDTQTGLRGIPSALIRNLLPLRSSRYEFEMDMLIIAAQSNFEISEEPIQTIYIGDNESSHFNPFFDSVRVYFCLLRFAFSSAATYALDVTIFYLAYSWGRNILLAHVLGRLGAVTLNFLLVRDFVFHARARGLLQILSYLGVVLVSGAVSYAAQITLVQAAALSPMVAKTSVESVLFFVNFLVLRDVIFLERQQRAGAQP
jgi:glycosyltransferase involved in cell wall biosynthesis